jgi:hypothetical protein
MFSKGRVRLISFDSWLAYFSQKFKLILPKFCEKFYA